MEYTLPHSSKIHCTVQRPRRRIFVRNLVSYIAFTVREQDDRYAVIYNLRIDTVNVQLLIALNQ